MKKNIIISILWNNGKPVLSFINLPISCTKEQEAEIRKNITEENYFKNVIFILKPLIDQEAWKENERTIEDVLKAIPNFSDIEVDFIEIPQGFSEAYALPTWMEQFNATERGKKFNSNEKAVGKHLNFMGKSLGRLIKKKRKN
ncbi:MAG: hypothetical protein NTY80_01370 [candidate division SR1 bacterium]|nr:hypothetical protein [candidate division SR1 bacterium]